MKRLIAVSVIIILLLSAWATILEVKNDENQIPRADQAYAEAKLSDANIVKEEFVEGYAGGILDGLTGEPQHLSEATMSTSERAGYKYGYVETCGSEMDDRARCVEQVGGLEGADVACPAECPQFMPPHPAFCSDGKIESGGTDECGCRLPPKCIR